MLTLNRKRGSAIVIVSPNGERLYVLSKRDGWSSLGFDVPDGYRVIREEAWDEPDPPVPETVDRTCCGCGERDIGAKPPRSWMEVDGVWYCAPCRKQWSYR